VASNDITDCKQLDGKNVGIFSEAGVSTAFLKIYLQENCPDAQPNYLVIADSPLRRQALEQGQLAATPLEPGDVVDIVAKSSDKFHVLANFGVTMPDIGRDIIDTNEMMLKDHPTIVQAFLKAELQAVRSLYANPGSVAQLDDQFLKLGDETAGISKFFVDNKVWCANGGLADQNISHSLDVFGKQYKLVPTTVTFDQLVDTGPMNAVLGELGKSDATTC
jgi:ABC-type nitrate/sulfonate/bicarbonate transport system substrate-binding protein